jgi:AcrR family transcriptional regulator
MKKTNKSKRVYASHRKNQREKILEVAENLFVKKDIAPVTMADIASASRLTRATIYKYFDNRKEIAFEIYKTIILRWRDIAALEELSRDGTGFQKIERFMTSFRDYLMRSPKETRFVAEFNHLYAREWPARQVLHALKSLEDVRRMIVECVRQGIKDGSLKSDLDPELTMAAIFNLNSSLLVRIGEMGKKLQDEFDLTGEQILTEIYRIFINGIKAHPEDVQAKQIAGDRVVHSRPASKFDGTKL